MVILCGTDFTSRAAEAAEVASSIAARTRAPLVLVHVLERGTLEDAVEHLRAEAERLRSLFSELQVTTRFEVGNADEILTDLARSEQGSGTRLVVVSSLGRRAPARWVLGSVAERTAQTSPVPVLVVRDAKPFVAWLRGDRPLRVVVGFDFSETATAALRWASDLGRVAPCDVVVAHVTWPPEERKRMGAHWAVPAFHSFPQLEVLLQNDLRARVREYAWASGSPKIRIALVARGRGDALAQLAADEQADLLVVGTRQLHGPNRLWSETVSRGALCHAAMSVACVPLVVERHDERNEDADEVEADLATKLESHPFLRGGSGDVLRRIASITREEKYAAGARLLREGADADTMFLLQSGHVALELDVPGKGPVQLESLRGGDLVGLSWLFPPYRWHFDARVVEPVVALAIDASKLRTWMTEDAAIGQVVAMRLVRQLYERLERVRLQRFDLYKAEP